MESRKPSNLNSLNYSTGHLGHHILKDVLNYLKFTLQTHSHLYSVALVSLTDLVSCQCILYFNSTVVSRYFLLTLKLNLLQNYVTVFNKSCKKNKSPTDTVPCLVEYIKVFVVLKISHNIINNIEAHMYQLLTNNYCIF